MDRAELDHIQIAKKMVQNSSFKIICQKVTQFTLDFKLGFVNNERKNMIFFLFIEKYLDIDHNIETC